MTAYDKISVAPAAGAIPDDTAMLRAAVDLTRDLTEPKPAIYWADFVASAALGYAGLRLRYSRTQPALRYLAPQLRFWRCIAHRASFMN
jgi:hypothetical protein